MRSSGPRRDPEALAVAVGVMVKESTTGARIEDGRPRIAYLVSLFPCYDETFILREMKALTDRGIPLRIFSLRRRTDPVVQPDAVALLPATRYSAYLLSLPVLLAMAWAVRRRWRVLGSVIASLVSDAWTRPATLAKSLAFIPKACLFARMCSEEGIVHLHAHWATYPATAALLISRLAGATWSFTCHAHDIFKDSSLLPQKLEAASFVLTCTSDNKTYLERISPVARERVTVSYHGLDLDVFKPLGTGASREIPELLGVGSLLECKGFDTLIDAAARLRDRGFRFHLRIAGGGPKERELREQIARLNLGDRVELTGYIRQDALVPLYQGADVFVLPAVREIHWGIPNVLVEALACGVPVVTTRLPSVPELVDDGGNGLLVPDRDPDELAGALATLLADPELRRSMGQAGRARVAELFDIDHTIDSVVEPLLERARAAD